MVLTLLVDYQLSAVYTLNYNIMKTDPWGCALFLDINMLKQISLPTQVNLN